MNLGDFRTRKTWGAPWRLLVDAPRDLGYVAMDDERPTPIRLPGMKRWDYVTILTGPRVIEGGVRAMT
jgi:hypothetical protein